MNVSNLKRAVGFSLHLGGYKDIDLRKLMKYSLSLPFINVSVLEQKEEFKTVSKQENRMEIYNWLWGAGWWEGGPEVKKTIKNGLVKEIFKDGANISFFVDFLYLTKEELIENLVVDPMLKMFAGNEDWVIKNKLPVWPITTDIGE